MYPWRTVLSWRRAEDQHALEALPADRADEALGEGVGPWRSNRRADDPDPLRSEDLVEPGRELGVAVAHQEPDGSRAFGEHNGVRL